MGKANAGFASWRSAVQSGSAFGVATTFALAAILAFAPIVTGLAAALPLATVFSFARVLIVDAAMGDGTD